MAVAGSGLIGTISYHLWDSITFYEPSRERLRNNRSLAPREWIGTPECCAANTVWTVQLSNGLVLLLSFVALSRCVALYLYRVLLS